MGADGRLFLCYTRNFYGNLLKLLLLAFLDAYQLER